jgi:mannose-6-phosphate isomerase
MDDPARTYRDQNHKPEVLCALTTFDALCGFREPSVSAALLRDLDVDGLAPVIDALDADDLGAAIAWLLEDRDGRAIADAVAIACARAGLAWTVPIASAHPGDLGLVTALLLHHVVLEPAEAIYLDAGTLHAYLHGTGIELMASSDNVLRGGLTEKHVDRAELQRLLVLAPSEPRIVRSEPAGAVMDVWRTPAPDFQLWRIEPGATTVVDVAGPEIVLCIGGTASISNTDASVELASGEAAFVAAAAGSYVATATGSLYRATVG